MFTQHGILIAGKLPGNHDQNSRVYDTNGLAPTLSTMQGGGQEPKIIQRGHGYNQGGEVKAKKCIQISGLILTMALVLKILVVMLFIG